MPTAANAGTRTEYERGDGEVLACVLYVTGFYVVACHARGRDRRLSWLVQDDQDPRTCFLCKVGFLSIRAAPSVSDQGGARNVWLWFAAIFVRRTEGLHRQVVIWVERRPPRLLVAEYFPLGRVVEHAVHHEDSLVTIAFAFAPIG